MSTDDTRVDVGWHPPYIEIDVSLTGFARAYLRMWQGVRSRQLSLDDIRELTRGETRSNAPLDIVENGKFVTYEHVKFFKGYRFINPPPEAPSP